MVPAYMFTIDVIASSEMDEATFHERIDPSLSYLHALQGSFDRKPSTLTYYPPSEQEGGCKYWSARGIVLISVGKERAEYLKGLYEAIFRLISLLLPDFEVHAENVMYKFD